MNHLTFSGHETFHCRPLWLKKGYDFVNSRRRFFDESAVVQLGVGKNMVTAIRYWLRAFAITNEQDEPQHIADYLLGDKGKDPYLENVGTLWLLHYFLVTKAKASMFSLVLNEFRKERIEFSKEQLSRFIKRKCELNDQAFNANTVSNDINVFIKTYLRPANMTKNIEDDFSGLLIELNLVQPLETFDAGPSSWFKIEGRDRQELPVEILLFSVLDNDNYGNSISFNELLNGYNSMGMVYALSANGLREKIEGIVSKCPTVTFTDDAGIRELQFQQKPNKWEILDQYYAK